MYVKLTYSHIKITTTYPESINAIPYHFKMRSQQLYMQNNQNIMSYPKKTSFRRCAAPPCAAPRLRRVASVPSATVARCCETRCRGCARSCAHNRTARVFHAERFWNPGHLFKTRKCVGTIVDTGDKYRVLR